MPRLLSVLKGTALLLTAFTSSLVSANNGQLGFSLGVKRNQDGQCKETADYESDLDILAPYTKIIRTYATSDCNTMQNIMPAVIKKGFKIVLGVWFVTFPFDPSPSKKRYRKRNEGEKIYLD